MERKIAEAGRVCKETLGKLGRTMAGIVEEMIGQGRRRYERLELLERHAQMTPTSKLPYREN